MKIVLYSLPQHGHVNPTLAVTRELVHRGHSVTYVITEEFRTKVEQAGGTFRPLGTSLDIAAEARRQVKRSQDGGLPPSAAFRVFLSFMARTMARLDELRDALVAEDPDLIIYDPMSLWGNVLARSDPRPRATFYTTYPMVAGDALSRRMSRTFVRALSPRVLPDLLRLAGSLVAARHKGFRVPSTPASLFTATEALNLVPLPVGLVPHGDRLDSSYLFFGPSLMPEYTHPGDPLPATPAGKRLYVSMGSTPLNNQPGLFRAVIDGFGGTDWNVIMNIGEADSASLGPLPANVMVRNYVPQIAVLKHHADVFLTHGGMNSVLESCSFGVPMLVLSLQPETQLTADQIQAKELGRRLDPSEITGSGLRETAESLLGDAATRQHLRAVQQELRSCGGAHQAVDALEAYARAGAYPE